MCTVSPSCCHPQDDITSPTKEEEGRRRRRRRRRGGGGGGGKRGEEEGERGEGRRGRADKGIIMIPIRVWIMVDIITPTSFHVTCHQPCWKATIYKFM